ncbi:MAG: DUF2953 domain-containing protein [Clostridia bacterium]|nr:DUF2953 domain-containing protein [Clostridia bacterium]
MFFIVSIIILLVVGILLAIIFNSKIEIEIKNLDISTIRKDIINKDYEIIVSLVILKKLKIIKFKIKKDKIRNIQRSKAIKNLDVKFLKRNRAPKGITSIIKELKIEIKKLEMYIEIGIEDAALTAISVGILSTIIAILLKDKITKKDKYEIKPIYIQKNLINLKINCIFRIHLMHYIYKQLKNNILKGRRDTNERKSSDRRAYAYSNE